VFAVNVLDAGGQQLSTLNVQDFRGVFRGKPVRVLSADLDASPRRMVLLLDTSQSMRDSRDWTFASTVAHGLVSGLASPGRLVVLSMGNILRQHSSLSGDTYQQEQALQEAQSQEPTGTTSLFRSLVIAAQAFPGPGFGDVIWLVSDGEDTGSQDAFDETGAAMARLGVRLFWVRPVAGLGVRKRRERPLVSSIVRATGGQELWSDAGPPEGVAAKVRSMIALATGAYRLTVELSEAVDKPRDWTLEVVDPKGDKLKNVQVVYPHLVVP